MTATEFGENEAVPSRDQNSRSILCVVVVRHGERLDYVLRDQGQNWVAENWGNRPWDPPLTTNGLEQAKALGQHLPNQLTKLQLPPLSRVYSSPFLRCRQTALGIAQTSPLMSNVSTDSNSVNQDLPEKIRVEWAWPKASMKIGSAPGPSRVQMEPGAI